MRGVSHAHTWYPGETGALSDIASLGANTVRVVLSSGQRWGQDWSFTMRDNAAEVFASDPAANTMFSIHMYGVFDTADEVGSYLNAFVDAGPPITVGEFGHNHSDGDPDEDAIMATAEALGVGYIGWSWSGNGGGVEYLDMVDGFDVNSLTEWGERIFNGENGIAATARPATVYTGGAPAAPGDGGPSGEPTVEASEVAPSEPVESGDPVLPPTDPTGQDDDPAPPAEPAPGGGFDLDGIREFLMQLLTMLLGSFPVN